MRKNGGWRRRSGLLGTSALDDSGEAGLFAGQAENLAGEDLTVRASLGLKLVDSGSEAGLEPARGEQDRPEDSQAHRDDRNRLLLQAGLAAAWLVMARIRVPRCGARPSRLLGAVALDNSGKAGLFAGQAENLPRKELAIRSRFRPNLGRDAIDADFNASDSGFEAGLEPARGEQDRPEDGQTDRHDRDRRFRPGLAAAWLVMACSIGSVGIVFDRSVRPCAILARPRPFAEPAADEASDFSGRGTAALSAAPIARSREWDRCRNRGQSVRRHDAREHGNPRDSRVHGTRARDV